MGAGHGHHGHGHQGHGHGHGHSHAHSHGHHHHHAPADPGRAFAIGIALNTGFVAVEAGFGLWGDSLALLADAGHNLADVLGLVIAWGAVVLGRVRPNARFTYGLRGSSILAALANGVILMFAAGAIALAAVQRFRHPVEPEGALMMIVAAVGILVNGATAWLFVSGARGDINMRGAFLHMAADAAVSAGVVVAGLLVGATGLAWIDPATGLVIVAVIVWGTWGLLKDALAMALGGVPPGIDAAAVRAHLGTLPGVTAIHDLHIWSMSTTETAMTVHIVMPGGADDAFLHAAADAMATRFGIGHATIQVERAAALCALEPADTV